MLRLLTFPLAIMVLAVAVPAQPQDTPVGLQQEYDAALMCSSQSMILLMVMRSNTNESRAEAAEAEAERYGTLTNAFIERAISLGSSLGKSQEEIGTEAASLMHDLTNDFEAAQRQGSMEYLTEMFAEVEVCVERFGA